MSWNSSSWNSAPWNGYALSTPVVTIPGTGPIISVHLSAAINWTIVLAVNVRFRPSMSKPLEKNIDGYVSGDPFKIPFTAEDWPSDRILDTAYFTVKRKATDSDADAILQKTITEVESSDGQITATGSGKRADGVFIVDKTSSALIEPHKRYAYDIRLIANDATPFTLAMGNITMIQGVTNANS